MEKYPLGCIIMASGTGKRFGGDKLLACCAGQPLLYYVLTLTEGLFSSHVVVTRNEKVAEYCAEQDVHCILHQKSWQSDTVSIGVTAMADGLRSKALLGLLFCVSDQPLLKRQSLLRLVKAFMQKPDYIHRLAYEEKAGNPVIFPADLADELRRLPQDKGGSFLVKKYPERVRTVQVQEEWELYDVDTREDLARLTAEYK